MLESEREFLKDLSKQFHDDRIAEVDINKALEQGKKEEAWEKARKIREYQEKAKIERYRREGLNEQERKASEAALMEMLKPINEQINHTKAREAAIMDKINLNANNQEGKAQIDRLLEITREKQDYINARIKEAETQGNELLLEEYTQEKADIEKDLEIYLSKYEEYKAAEEG